MTISFSPSDIETVASQAADPFVVTPEATQVAAEQVGGENRQSESQTSSSFTSSLPSSLPLKDDSSKPNTMGAGEQARVADGSQVNQMQQHQQKHQGESQQLGGGGESVSNNDNNFGSSSMDVSSFTNEAQDNDDHQHKENLLPSSQSTSFTSAGVSTPTSQTLEPSSLTREAMRKDSAPSVVTPGLHVTESRGVNEDGSSDLTESMFLKVSGGL